MLYLQHLFRHCRVHIQSHVKNVHPLLPCFPETSVADYFGKKRGGQKKKLQKPSAPSGRKKKTGSRSGKVGDPVVVPTKWTGGQWQAIPKVAGGKVQSEGEEDERSKKKGRGGYKDWSSLYLWPLFEAALEWEKMSADAKDLG